MSYLNLLTPASTRNTDAELRLRPGPTVADLEIGTLEGFGDAVLSSVPRGLARVGEAAGLALASPFVVLDELAGSEGNEDSAAAPVFRALVEPARRAVDFYAPDVRTTGTAGRVVGGLLETLTPLALGPAGPAALVGTQGLSGGADVLAEGGSATGAAAAGTIRAAAAAVGFGLPASIGGRIGTRLLSGAAINVGAGAAARGLEAGALALAGDTQLASQRLAEFADPETYVFDALLGAAFGAVGPRFRPADADAILSSRSAENFTTRSAPGAPADPLASAAHQRALDEALELLSRGEPVRLSPGIEEAAFVPRVEPAVDTVPITDLLDDGLAVEPLPDAPGDPFTALAADPEPRGAGPLSEPEAVAAAGAEPAASQPAAAPIAAAARATITEAGDALIATGTAEDGSTTYRPASEVLAEIDAEHATATNEAKAYEAAITCYLGNGA